MASLFSSPPKPQKMETPPSEAAPEAQSAAADLKKKYRGSGRGSTVLTSPTGIATPAPTAAKTLLGS
jgi:hypothetical protein